MVICVASMPFVTFAQSSTNYQLQSYSIGGGGDTDLSSAHYKAAVIAGEDGGDQLSSTNYKANTGLIFTLMAHVPPAPSFTNPGSNYDRLKFIIDTGGNASDAEFVIAISEDNFSSDTRYIQSDNTIGSSQVWQTYTNWGDATGEYVTGLKNNTTYYIKVKTRQGNYSESYYGPTASAATTDPSLSFGIDSATITFDRLNGGNSYTDSSKSTVLTTSTNAYNGYIVYARETAALTSPVGTIPDYTSPNSAPTTWSGTGFGYTTDDTNLSGGTASRFSGDKYAGFTTSSPGDPVADHSGPVLSPISNETFTISYRVTADSLTKAGTYTTTILYIVAPEY